LANAYSVQTASALRAAGLEAVVWTVNDYDEARRVRDLGALALCTDYPRRIADALSAS
jgi:glycerophosphoryl diester phosphodiesterase